MSSVEKNKLPDGWVEKKLKDKEVCELIMGQSPSSDTYNVEGNGMPFFQGKKEFGEVSPTVEKYCTAPKKIAYPGDILMSVRAPVGPTNIANIECCIGRGLAAIRPNLNFTLKNYLLYYFRNFEVEISKKGKGSTFSAITKNALEESIIPIPSLEEQKRIVAKIDTLFAKIDKAISLTEASLVQAKNLLPSVLNEVFEKGKADGWKEKKLGDIAFLKSGSTPSRSNNSYWDEGTIPWLKSGELNDVMEIKEYTERITKKALDETSVKLFEKGTLLIAMYGATAGKLGILSIDATTNQAVCSIQNKKGMFNNHFVFYFFYSIRKKIIGDSFGGAQPNISKTYLENVTLCLPELSIQEKTVRLCNELSLKTKHAKSRLEKQLAYLKQLKSSILSKAFKGEL